MTNPITHLLFSWVIAALIVKKPGDRLLVIISGIFMDIDVFFGHHGPLHTPFSAFVIFVIILIVKRFEFRVSMGCLFGGLYHIFLDLLATRCPVMLFYPLNLNLYNIGGIIPYSALIILKFILLFSAILLTYYLWCKGEKPTEIIEWSKERFGSEITYISLIIFLCLIAYGSYRYMPKLLEILF